MPTQKQARRPERTVGHGCDRALAVGACDEEALEMSVRPAEGFHQRLDVGQPELDAELLER
jgi:hypothetical protein